MVQLSQTLVHHFLEYSAITKPDKTALIHEDVRATYKQINSEANKLARWLLDHNITNGDRVILILENCVEYVIGYYGVLKAGAAVISLSSDIKPEGLKFCLGEIEPKVIISSSKRERLLQNSSIDSFNIKYLLLNKIKHTWNNISFKVFLLDKVIRDYSTLNPDISVKEDALSSIIYTSGSTGKPKGVMLSHTNIVANTRSICQYLKLTDKDIQMVVLPFFYVMGKSLLNTHFAVGGTIVINNKFAFPASVLNQMVQEKITGFSGVPSTYAYLLHRSPLKKFKDKLNSIRYCSQAGGHMSKQIKMELKSALPEKTKIYIMYGATEASARLTYLDPDMFEDKIDSIGKAISGVKMRIMDENGCEITDGQTGELVGSGQNIMMGYWKDISLTKKVLDHNGYHTGDLGYKDKEGFLHVVGRKDNLLKVGGHRINSNELEDVFLATELVLEVAILGISDSLMGHKLAAVVAPKNNDIDAKQLLGECAKRLPKFKLPSIVRIVRVLPKGANGKIDREKCFEIVNKTAN